MVVFFIGLSPAAPLRLVGGLHNSKNVGRVEVEIRRQGAVWATVCDEGWGLEDAQVVCQQLGYTAAVGAPVRGFYGHGRTCIVKKLCVSIILVLTLFR